MSAPMEPRVEYQAQWISPMQFWMAIGDEESSIEMARICAERALFANYKRRIVKITTTYEVVEEMEPK